MLKFLTVSEKSAKNPGGILLGHSVHYLVKLIMLPISTASSVSCCHVSVFGTLVTNYVKKYILIYLLHFNFTLLHLGLSFVQTITEDF